MAELSPYPELEALTAWWEELGVDVDEAAIRTLLQASEAASGARPKPPSARQDAPATPAGPRPRRPASRTPQNWAQIATEEAAACRSLSELKDAITAFEGCPLKANCQSTVVCDGVEGAPILVIGEGPGQEEDRRGLPFVGKAGQLLDRMLAAIGVAREENALTSNVNFWRPPNNRNPEPDELLVAAPFVNRLIALTAPRLIIAVGGVSAKALTGSTNGIMKLRGSEQTFTAQEGEACPLFPIFHPAYLLRRPKEKPRAWRDLLQIEARAKALGVTLLNGP